MNGNIANAAAEAENGNPDKMFALATVAQPELAQEILRKASQQHAAEVAKRRAKWNATELDENNW